MLPDSPSCFSCSKISDQNKGKHY